MKNCIKIAVLLMSISTFSQGPWTKEKGKFYTQISFTTIPSYDDLFGQEEITVDNRDITDNTFQLYGEYGFTDKTTLIVNLPFKLIKINGNNQGLFRVGNNIFPEGQKRSLGNIEIGVKHNFYKKNWLISSQFSVEAKTGSFDENSGIRTGYDAWSFTPLLLTGKSYNKSYLQTFIGAKLRTNNYSSNFKIGGEYGSKITKHIWLVGFLDIEKSFKNGDIVLPASNLATGLYVNDQEYGIFGVKVIGEFSNNLGITASLPAAFYGNNVAKQVALSFGIYKKF
jgi:hypothetical protein